MLWPGLGAVGITFFHISSGAIFAAAVSSNGHEQVLTVEVGARDVIEEDPIGLETQQSMMVPRSRLIRQEKAPIALLQQETSEVHKLVVKASKSSNTSNDTNSSNGTGADVPTSEWPAELQPLIDAGGCNALGIAGTFGITCTTDLASFAPAQLFAPGSSGTLCKLCLVSCDAAGMPCPSTDDSVAEGNRTNFTVLNTTIPDRTFIFNYATDRRNHSSEAVTKSGDYLDPFDVPEILKGVVGPPVGPVGPPGRQGLFGFVGLTGPRGIEGPHGHAGPPGKSNQEMPNPAAATKGMLVWLIFVNAAAVAGIFMMLKSMHKKKEVQLPSEDQPPDSSATTATQDDGAAAGTEDATHATHGGEKSDDEGVPDPFAVADEDTGKST